MTGKSTSQTTGHKTRRWRARAHVPARAQASSVVQCRALRMPSHRRSLDYDPLKPTMRTCAGQCFARAQQCPANPRPPGCTTLPRSACVCACASVAAMQRARPARPSQAQSPARPGTPHRRLWSTTGTGRSTSRAHADSARALSASAFGPTERHLDARVPPPASVLAKLEQRGTVTPPRPRHSAGSAPRPERHHRAASWSTTAAIPGPRAALLRRALLRQGSAMPGFSPVLVGQRCWGSQRFACVSQSAGALSPKARLASHRADWR